MTTEEKMKWLKANGWRWDMDWYPHVKHFHPDGGAPPLEYQLDADEV